MQPIQLSIPTPCHEDWDKMTPNQQGRFCGSCAKTVIDFSVMTDAQMLRYFENLKHENVCGKVYPDQLNRKLQPAPVMQPRKKLYWLWQYAAALLLFFTKGVQAKAQGEVRIKSAADTNKVSIANDIPIRLGGIRKIDVPVNVHVLPAPIAQLFITDENNQPIAGASVQLLPQQNFLVTDTDGRVNLGKAHSIKGIQVSAIGYEAQEFLLKDIQGNSVQLKPKLEKLDEVVVQSNGVAGGLKGMLGGISVRRIYIVENVNAAPGPKNTPPFFSVFPNPVQKGKELSFTINATENKNYKIVVSDMSGKMMLQQNLAVSNKTRQKKLAIPSLWSSGTYILSVVDEKGATLQSEKILLL